MEYTFIGLAVILLSCVIKVLVAEGRKKKTNPKREKTIVEELGDNSELVRPSGYYYHQADNQPVVERSEEQQKIFEEYFVIQNYQTIKCDIKWKKIGKICKILSLCAFVIGLLLIGGYVFNSTEGSGVDNTLIFGAVGMVGGLVLLFVYIITKSIFEKSVSVTVAPKAIMTDEEYEALVEKKIQSLNIKQLGLEKLGLDPDEVKEISPIILSDDVVDEKYSLTVYSDTDKSLHSSTKHVTYIYFTDEQLFVYKLQFDMCCNVQDEYASEFFYEDICDVSSHVSKNIIKTNNKDYEYAKVYLNIIAYNSQIGFVLDGENENVGSLQAMKQKIREKKKSRV